MPKFIFKNTTEIFYHKEGAGNPVILLHGFGEDSSIWDGIVKDLAKHCLLIRPDIPGSGQSQKLEGEGIRLEDFADVVHALLLVENIAKCIFLGHSMGGYIALAFAKKYPEMLAGFGLVNSTAFADDEGRREKRIQSIRMVEEYGSVEFLQKTLPGYFSAAFCAAHPDFIQQYVDKAKVIAAETLIQYYQAMMQRPDRTDVLQNSVVPVLFICGTEDGAAPLDDMLKQVHLPKISYIHILKNIGHKSMFEAREEMCHYLIEFILAIKK